jgi:CheY-like chemotaxis protein
MNRTKCCRPLGRGARDGVFPNPPSGALLLFSRKWVLLLALLPACTLAAPGDLPLLSTGVPTLWVLLLGVAFLGVLAAAVSLSMRLRFAADSIGAQVTDLQSNNANLYRQLQARGQELAARERDLSEARNSLEQLREEKSDFLVVVNHRLRQPLDALQSSLNLLARSSSDEGRQLANMARQQGEALLRALEETHRLGGYESVEITLAPEPGVSVAGLSILLVESGSHDSLSPLLQVRGHSVQQESNGVDGTDAALRGKFDLILLDSRLPLMDGVEAAQKIRNALGREMPIVALVAGLRAGDRERYLALGMTGVLARPVAESQLEQLLNWATKHARKPAAAVKKVRPARMLNTSALCRQRDTLGHLAFAELLGDRIATLPKKTTSLTSALTGRHWLDAEQLAQSLATNADEIGLEAAAGRLRGIAARLSVDSEREYCRHQRTEVLNLMRTSIQQLKSWREQNVHTEWALRQH